MHERYVLFLVVDTLEHQPMVWPIGMPVGLLVLFLPDGCAMLMRSNKAKTAVHGCHCLGDMAVRMRKVLARPWVGVRVCHLLLLLLHKFTWHTDRQLRLIHLPSACRGGTAVRFPATSSHMCCVELALKGVLCTLLGSKGQTTWDLKSYFCPTTMP